MQLEYAATVPGAGVQPMLFHGPFGAGTPGTPGTPGFAEDFRLRLCNPLSMDVMNGWGTQGLKGEGHGGTLS